MASTTSHNSPFDRLPREVRYLFYEHLADTCGSRISHTLEPDNMFGSFQKPRTKDLPTLALTAKRFRDEFVNEFVPKILPRHQELDLRYTFQCLQPMSPSFFPDPDTTRHLTITVKQRDPFMGPLYRTFSDFPPSDPRAHPDYWGYAMEFFDLPACFPNLQSLAMRFCDGPHPEWNCPVDTLELLLHRAVAKLPNIKEYWLGIAREDYGTLFVKKGNEILCFSTLDSSYAGWDFVGERTREFLVGNGREIVAENPSFSIRNAALE